MKETREMIDMILLIHIKNKKVVVKEDLAEKAKSFREHMKKKLLVFNVNK